MNDEETLELVRSYHHAWTTDKDFEAAGLYLSDALQTDLPLNTYRTKAEFVEAIRGFGQLVSSVQVIAEFATSDEALLLYDLEMSPIGTLRMAEHFKLASGRIVFIRVVNDTAALRAAGFAPPLPARA